MAVATWPSGRLERTSSPIRFMAATYNSETAPPCDQLCATDEVGIEHGEATCDSRYGRQQTDHASSRVGGADDRQCADQRECGRPKEARSRRS